VRDLKVRPKIERRGFTIPEVLLVVVIIGLISGAGTGLYVTKPVQDGIGYDRWRILADYFAMG
jgi:prepilin-type N-terminal cleavage/methylation domain-containing protein